MYINHSYRQGYVSSSLKKHTFLKELTLNLLTTTIVAPPSNASKWQMGFNSVFKGLKGIYGKFPHQNHVKDGSEII
jgi:hypothetical protein